MFLHKKLVRIGTLLSLALAASMAHGQLKSELYVSGLTLPVAIVQDPTDATKQYVVEQRASNVGRIRVVLNGVLQPTPFLSISPVATGNEQGLLGLALAPDFATSGNFYVNYTDSAGATRVERYTRSTSNPLIADPATKLLIITIAQPFDNHNGGNLNFGDDGYLYMGMGDGGNGNDPGNRAQTVTNMLLGKMLRLDPTRDDFPADPNKNYGIPPTNPFVGRVGDDEIWALGVRNPWRWSFDSITRLGTGGLWINDVGQSAREEIDFAKMGVGGQNYGWRVMEGFQNTGLGGLSTDYPTLTPPIYDYDRTFGQSTTGGFVYRGVQLGPEFWGRYFYADYVAGKVWSLAVSYDGSGNATVSGNVEHTAALGGTGTTGNVSSFGLDAAGELFFLNYGGGKVYRIRPLNRVWMTDMTADQGLPVSGQALRYLVAADGNLAVIGQNVAGSREQAAHFQGGVKVGFLTDQMSATQLNLTVVANVTGATGVGLQVLLKNWSTGNFDVVGTGSLSTSQQTFNFSGISASTYRRADGRIEMLTRGDVFVPSYSSRVALGVDQVRIQAS